MDFEKYTDRPRGRPVGADLALARGHQQFTPEHLLKVLLDDAEGLGGRADPARRRRSARGAARGPKRRSPSCPRSRAAAPASRISTPTLARVFDQAEQVAKKAGDTFVTVERLLLALAIEQGAEAAKIARRTPASRRRR